MSKKMSVATWIACAVFALASAAFAADREGVAGAKSCVPDDHGKAAACQPMPNAGYAQHPGSCVPSRKACGQKSVEPQLLGSPAKDKSNSKEAPAANPKAKAITINQGQYRGYAVNG